MTFHPHNKKIINIIQLIIQIKNVVFSNYGSGEDPVGDFNGVYYCRMMLFYTFHMHIFNVSVMNVW